MPVVLRLASLDEMQVEFAEIAALRFQERADGQTRKFTILYPDGEVMQVRECRDGELVDYVRYNEEGEEVDRLFRPPPGGYLPG